jgi:hypothetical protein
MTDGPQPVEVGLLERGGSLRVPTRRIAALERGDGVCVAQGGAGYLRRRT